jgi:feruloyl esterase
LQHGFAVTYTNTGHDAAAEPLATFTANPQKLVDFAFRSIHVTIETAKQVVRAYYGQAQSRAYFDGCSTGGRQGLTEAQRFPADFDGIIVGAPMLDYVGTMISTVWIDRALTGSHLTSNKLKTLAERIYARCDEKDGLKDGLIDDPRPCDFVPTRDLPACSEGADAPSCFSRAQIDALQTVYSDVMSSGKPIFPGWPLGGEIDGPNLMSPSGHSPGWVPMLINDGDQSFAAQLTEAFFRHMAYPRPDPTYQLTQFDFDKDPARLATVRQLMDANDPDLSRFRDRGGKLLMYWGWADPALNPRMGIQYYDRVAERAGRTSGNFFRLFMAPGMFHCAGGVGPSAFDAVTPLIRWVENGAAPDRLVASRVDHGQVIRTRPLCPYPQVARYLGTGSVDDAENFVCRQP